MHGKLQRVEENIEINIRLETLRIKINIAMEKLTRRQSACIYIGKWIKNGRVSQFFLKSFCVCGFKMTMFVCGYVHTARIIAKYIYESFVTRTPINESHTLVHTLARNWLEAD